MTDTLAAKIEELLSTPKTIAELLKDLDEDNVGRDSINNTLTYLRRQGKVEVVHFSSMYWVRDKDKRDWKRKGCVGRWLMMRIQKSALTVSLIREMIGILNEHHGTSLRLVDDAVKPESKPEPEYVPSSISIGTWKTEDGRTVDSMGNEIRPTIFDKD